MLYGQMNGIPVKAKFNSIQIILYSPEISYIEIGKHTQKVQKNKTKTFRWSTERSDLQKHYMTNVQIILPELDTMKSVM